MQSQKQKSLERLQKLYKNLDTGMTRAKYLDMCEQLNKEPRDDEIPPDWEDFPDIVHEAINTFNSLGDRVYPDIGYTGKDYTNLPYFTAMYEHNRYRVLPRDTILARLKGYQEIPRTVKKGAR